jgi:UDP-N-acetylglucosamine--N-acetylmuramyl-(pentapeptide) pyrophosphoryl-undecaprenol N-acetylglucosamine transferase
VRIIISGGGTGGHIYPGVAIGKKILEKMPDAKILFVGSKNGLEKKLVPREGFDIKYITVEGLNKKFTIKKIGSFFKVFKGYFQSLNIIKEFKPDIVVGTGGYVCGPVVLAASMKNIPTLIHEQNAFPGMTNKMLSRFVSKIAINFKESEEYFPKNKVVYTGNPIRSQFTKTDKAKSRIDMKFDINKPLLLVVGGSRGARNINNAVVNIIPQLMQSGIQLLFITGENEYENVKTKLKSINMDINSLKGIKIIPYCFNMDEAMAACDLIISRAGATVLSEITALGIPSILIPSPFVANNHQEYNARAIERNGAAIVITESQLESDILREQVINIINNKQVLKEMSANAKKLSNIDAADKIYEIIINLVSK